jgi:hypothetical protein
LGIWCLLLSQSGIDRLDWVPFHKLIVAARQVIPLIRSILWNEWGGMQLSLPHPGWGNVDSFLRLHVD